jgi:hypothetical protein
MEVNSPVIPLKLYFVNLGMVRDFGSCAQYGRWNIIDGSLREKAPAGYGGQLSPMKVTLGVA